MGWSFVQVFTVKKLRGSMNYHTSPTRLPLLRWQLKPRRCDTSKEKGIKSKDLKIIIYIASLNKAKKNDRCCYNKLNIRRVFQYSPRIKLHAVNSNCVIRWSIRKIIFKDEKNSKLSTTQCKHSNSMWRKVLVYKWTIRFSFALSQFKYLSDSNKKNKL